MSKIKEQNSSERLESAENTEDQEFDKWVRHQFLEEAKDIEKEIGQIPDSKAWEPTEEKFQELLQKAKKQGTIQDPTDFIQKLNKEKRDDTKEKVVKKHSQKPKAFNFREKVIRWTAAAAVTIFGIFGVSMSSEANRAYIMEKVDRMLGNHTQTEIDNSGSMKSGITEQEASANIEDTLNINIPQFYYLPEEMTYQNYSIDSEAQMAIMQYSYNGNALYLLVFSNQKNASAIAVSGTGKEIQEVHSNLVENVDAILWEILEQGDEQATYVLQWEYKNSYYELSGKIDQDEMVNIAENILY